MALSTLVFLLLSVMASGQNREVTKNILASSVQGTVTGGNGVWNFTLGFLHPPLFVNDYSDGTVKDRDFDVGDGVHGSFEASRYSQFGTVQGTLLVIDTDTWSEIKVTQFVLASGWTLQPTGSQPLVVRSLSDVTINGVLDCSGGAGADSSATLTDTISGGSGRCGGADGGAGGNNGGGAGAGTNASGSVTGGGAGTAAVDATGGAGGGGGGGVSSDPAAAGTNTNVAGGAAGGDSADDDFTSTIGGAGGGGGGLSTFGGAPTTGAGGGAGGGAIMIFAARDVTLAATGQITANGGDGGDSAGHGGAGGSGAGGGVWIAAGRDVVFSANVTAVKGTAGSSTNGGNGGAGSDGRTWITDTNGAAAGTVENPPSFLVSRGSVEFNTTTDTVFESNTVDLQSSQPSFVAATATSQDLGGGSVTVELAGSSDGQNFSTYQSSAALSVLDGLRYFKYRVTLDSDQAAYAPGRVESVQVTYTPHQENDFEFVPACGSISSNGVGFVLWALALFLVWGLFRRRKFTSLKQCQPLE